MEWTWGSTDKKRAEKAAKIKILNLRKDDASPSLECEGSKGEHYYVTLNSCTCNDFYNHGSKTACKHMVCLAMQLGLLNKDGLTPHDQFLKDYQQLEDYLARCAWYYYVLDSPLISDAEYDELKAEYMKWLEKVE